MVGRLAQRLRGRGMARAAGAGVLGLSLVATSAPVRAADDDQGRPWARGTIRPSFGFGFGYSSDLVSLGFGLGASYYVIDGLSFGLSLSDQILIYSSDLKASLPGVENQIPTNAFRITPSAQYVFFRRPRFSPYVQAGIGPTFFNNDNGTFGHWNAGPGAYIWLAGPVYLDVGVNFSGMFPTGQCNDAFSYQPSGGEAFRVFDDYCAFRWGPRLGIVLAFGGGRRSEPRSRRPRGRATPTEAPPPNPMREPEPAVVVPPPAEAPPAEAQDIATPPAAPAPAEAPPEVGPEPPPANDVPPPTETSEPTEPTADDPPPPSDEVDPADPEPGDTASEAEPDSSEPTP